MASVEPDEEMKEISGKVGDTSGQMDETSGQVDEDYSSYWSEFKLRTDEKEKTVEFLKNLKTVDFSGISSMLSIGAGEADVDFDLIKCSCPKLQKYIAVEPRAESVEIIREKFKQLPHIQVETAQSTMQEYAGPSDPVDLVFICNSSYYFRDAYDEQMRRALSWLSPDGHLIDIRDNQEDFPYRQKLKLMGRSPGRSMKEAQKGFLNWCFENGWDVDGSVENKEYTVDYSIDISEPGLDQVLKLLVHTLPEDEMGKAKEAIRDSVIKGTTRVPGKQLIIVISRAPEGAGDQGGDAGDGKESVDAGETSTKRAGDAEVNGTAEVAPIKIPRKEGEGQADT